MPLLAQEVPPAAAEPAQANDDITYRVGIIDSPPFVMNATTDPSGIAIELWESVAKDRGYEFNYIVYPSIREILRATRASEIDVAVADMTITRERAETMNFTQPWYDGGLRIMVDEPSQGGLRRLFNGLRDAGFLRYYAWIGGLILVGTLGLTLFDRRYTPNYPARWRDGLAESFYNIMSIATSGKMPNRAHLFGWIGRVWQAIWLVGGVAVVAFVTSSVTSVMTTQSLERQINSLEDLPGKTVAVLDGSVAEDVAYERGLDVVVYNTMGEATEALHTDAIDALVGDAPLLEYYAVSHPEDSLDVVGPIFHPVKYGFAVPLDSPLTRDLTLEVLDAQEAEEVQALQNEYFGPRD
ncbi:transporter substrate-binding domain-containing protein [Tropicimonas sp. IMCC34043]|uniref:transporter substrate-binding domain-containing protein n=1 Tax=Tropicimonas sp. IMCC34043 TaxID=2248760 RepID=UPI000E23972F|nr:transporter substrate-binding domain-containing protein [Tropicimonas sp. IMCC34043]